MSCNSALSFTLIRKTLPIYCSSSSPASPNLLVPSLWLLSHGRLSLKNSASLSRLLLSGDSPEFPRKNPPEFPQKSPIPQPTVPREVPEISTDPEIDPSTPPEVKTTNLPPLSPGQNPGPEFPIPPAPSPPGPEFPNPPLPSPPGIDVPPHKPSDIEPPKPGPQVPGPDHLPPPQPDVVPPRPAGPEIVTTPSPPDSVPPMALFRHGWFTFSAEGVAPK